MGSRSGSHNRQRIAHVLKRIGGKRLPQRMIFFDVETERINDEGDQRMTLLVACHWIINNKTGVESIEWFNTRRPSKFYPWILSHLKANKATRIMSANIWFDFRNAKLYEYMMKDRWRCSNFYTKGHINILKFWLKNWRLEFVNIQNYFDISVSEIGKSVGLPKLSTDYATTNKKELLAYCKRDVEIIYMAFRNLYMFVKENNLGNLAYTLPGVSYGFFTHSFMRHTLKTTADKDVLNLERQAYLGGRVECFFIGKPAKGKYYRVDVNAMYPFIMRSNYFPTKYLKSGTNVSTALIVKAAPLYCYVAECEIDTPLPIYACQRDEKLIFPTGCFVTTLTTSSLLYGIKHGHVKKVRKLACYKKGIVFKRFVDYFYNQRMGFKKTGNMAFSYVCKLILNSLYGKFGQWAAVLAYSGKTKIKRNFRRRGIHRQTRKAFMHTVFFGREIYTWEGEEEAHNSIPTIAAHVTDYARLYLWSLISKAGQANCFYCDTDSLIVNEKGYQNLFSMIDPDKIGMLKVEEISAKVHIRGAKNYTFGKESKIKGIKRGTKQNKDGSYTYTHFPGMISELRQGIRDDYRIEVQTKYLTGIYDKGVVMPGGRVIPFRLYLGR